MREEALKSHLDHTFDLPAIQRCQKFHQGLNTTYRVDTAEARYVARIVSLRNRTKADLIAEATLLTHLKDQGLPVQAPIPQCDGGFISELPTAEAVILLEFVSGEALFISAERHMTEAQARRFGEVLARIHEATNTFDLRFDKPRLSLDYLLRESIDVIAAKTTNTKQATQLDRQAQNVARQIDDLALATSSPVYGICHGDYFPGNAIWQADDRCVIIDFDFSAYGYRAYDIGTFWGTLATRVPDLQLAEVLRVHFLAGYESIRKLLPNERVSLPLFAIVNQIYTMRLRLEAIEANLLPPLNAEDWAKRFRQLEGIV